MTLGALDFVFSPTSLPLKGQVALPKSADPAWSKLRIGVGLSGGGYRAALVHAGVLQELAEYNIPVTNIASVSGGSIIAAFVSRGGDPSDFVNAVKAGRFRFKRELLSAFALPRWVLPIGSYSRRDVQASIVRRVLLGQETPRNQPLPELMLAMTDLRRGLSIGATQEGFMLAGPTTARFFRDGQAIAIDGLGDLASMVAVSGAFPGAVSALETNAKITMVPDGLDSSPDTRLLPLTLADGGVRDNLGLKLMQSIDREARGTGHTSLSWDGFNPGAKWALDVIIVSDGGQSFDAVESPLGAIGQVWRAIGLNGLETGILRPIQMSSALPIIALSTASEIGLSPDAVIVQSATRAHSAARRDVFRALQVSNDALARIVDLIPAHGEAQKALANYERTNNGSLNITDIDERCSKPSNRDAAECHWRTLVDLVLDDIDQITEVFRTAATLEDQYSAEDADALVRLGRYFVIFKSGEIKRALTSTSNED